MFDNIEVEAVDFVADDGRWDDDEWVNNQAELSAAEEGIEYDL